MQKNLQKPSNESPFFNLLADADEVQIREVPAKEASLRTFFVHIKTPTPAKPVVTTEKLPYDGTQLQRSAELLLENEDYLLARNIYSYLLQENLRDAIALRGLGICLFKLGEVVSSRKCFRAMVELFQSEEAHYWLGLGYLSEGKDAVAAVHFDRILSPEAFQADQRFDYFKNFGNCLTRLGQLDRAETKYSQALELSPTSDTIHVNLGTLLIQRRDWERARERFNRAVELNPKSSRALCGLGLTALAVGNVIEAKSFFHRSLDIDPQNIVSLHQLLEQPSDVSEYPVLKARLRAYLEKDPNHADTHAALATLLFKEGGWKACEVHVRRALECDPSHERATKLQTELNTLVRSQAA